MVVDDEPLVRQSIERMLKFAGHNVVAVDNGEAALALLAERKFDVVMTDFSMPGMQGDQLVARIRQMLPHQPIILATAFAEEFKVFGQPGSSVDALLLKPFSLQELKDAISRVLSPAQSVMPGAISPSAGQHDYKKK